MAEKDYTKITNANYASGSDNRGASKKKAIPVLASQWNKLVVGKNKISADEIVGTTSTSTALTITNAGSTASTQMLNLVSESLTPADADKMYISFTAESDTGVAREMVRLSAESVDVSNGSEDASFEISCMVAGTLTKVWDTQVSTGGAATTTAPIGDFALTDGSITIVDADNAASLSVTNNTITTANMVDLISTAALTTTGCLLSLVGDSATTATGLLTASGTALTDGWVGQLTGGGANATASGGVLDIVAGASTLGSGIRVVSTGAATSTTVGHLLELQDDSNALGIGVHATFDGLTTGEGVLLTHATSVIADGGSVFRITDSGINTGGATNGATLDIQSSGQLAGSVARIDSILTTGTALNVNSSGAYTGTAGIFAVNGTNSTTGDVAVFTGGGAGQSTSAGSVLQVNNAGATDGSDLEINHSTGEYVGTKGLLDIDGDAATTGYLVDINGAGLTSGRAINVTVGAGSTGPAMYITGGSGIEHATQMKTIMASPTVGTGCDGALVAQWACYGRHGGSTTTGIIKSELYIDLTDLVSSTTLNDIIGEDDAANAHFGQITAAIHGTIFGMEIECLETPAGGDPDIDFNVGTAGTDAEDVDVTGIAGYVQLLARGAAWAIEDRKTVVTALPAANDYLILSVGAGGTAAAYTAGKFKITFYGL
jgi:hypothetical protein